MPQSFSKGVTFVQKCWVFFEKNDSLGTKRYNFQNCMCVYLRVTFKVSSIILTSFRKVGKSTLTSSLASKGTPKKSIQIRVKRTAFLEKYISRYCHGLGKLKEGLYWIFTFSHSLKINEKISNNFPYGNSLSDSGDECIDGQAIQQKIGKFPIIFWAVAKNELTSGILPTNL